MPYRRLVSKYTDAHAVARLVALFLSCPAGSGRGMVAATQRFTIAGSVPNDNIVVKLDFSNAFICLRRAGMYVPVGR